MRSSEKPELRSLKLGILMKYLKANSSVSFGANIEWLDWITTEYKPKDEIQVIDAKTKLEDLEKRIIELSKKEVEGRTVKASYARIIQNFKKAKLFPDDGIKHQTKYPISESVVDEDTGIILTFDEIRQIIRSVNRTTIPPKDIIDAYNGAGRWIEGISPEIRCFYENPDGTTPKGEVGAVAVADALSLLVEPYSYKFGYEIENKSKAKALYDKLLVFREKDEFGEGGFSPGDDVPSCARPIVESTAIASIALSSYYSYLDTENKKFKNETENLNIVKEQIKLSIKWLIKTQFDEGYWSTIKSDQYKQFPDVQATQVALVALGLASENEIYTTEDYIQKSFQFIENKTNDGGWGDDFKEEYDPVATARMLWALIMLPKKHKEKVGQLIEPMIQKFKDSIKDKDTITNSYHVEEIWYPDKNGKRLNRSTKWYIPIKPFIISTLLQYYINFKEGKIDEDIEKYIQEGILEIISSKKKFGGWFGTQFGTEDEPAPSSTYYHARTLFHKAMQEYSYLKNALKVKEQD